MQQTKEKLFNRDFSLIIIGQIISLLGNVTLRFALSLFILDKTGSAAIFGTILAVATIPTVLLSPLGGVLADRVSKKWIMVVLDAITAILIVCVSFTIKTDFAVTAIAIGMVIFSVIHCFYQPSVQASVPLVVGNQKLMAANGVVTQVNALANLVGPILGGVLYSSIGIMPMLYICAGCYAFSSLMEVFIFIPFIKQNTVHENTFVTIKNDLKEAGKVMMLENKILLKSLISIALFNLVMSCFLIVGLPVIVKMFLGMQDIYYSFAQSAMGVGSIIGAITMGALAKKIKPQKIYIFLICSSFTILLMAVGTYFTNNLLFAYGMVIASVLLTMGFATMFSVYAQTILQQVAPVHLLGKVGAFSTAVLICTMPLGQAAYGFLFELFLKPNMSMPLMITGIAIICFVCSFISKRCFDYFKKSTIKQTAEKMLLEVTQTTV